MNDPGLNDLLKWSIENSSASRESTSSTTEQPQQPTRPLNADALNSLFGGPSDADLMKHAMAVILSNPTDEEIAAYNSNNNSNEGENAAPVTPETILENKLTAFDNLEQLIENIDNANNLEALGLWTPLIGELGNKEGKMRMMAAWCVGTAVQNNERAQERLLIVGGIPKLVEVATQDKDDAARRKSIYALSSAVRNFQPALDEAVKHLPAEFVPASSGKRVDSGNMDVIDEIMTKLRSHKPVDA
ncbi:hsp70 nucleotide exchange factor fes1 [Arachnomyces sp. PD_36]|nr:hsp70 nucleotide exchange factor fes1 [Arachnomyces sp. PD_36]